MKDSDAHLSEEVIETLESLSAAFALRVIDRKITVESFYNIIRYISYNLSKSEDFKDFRAENIIYAMEDDDEFFAKVMLCEMGIELLRDWLMSFLDSAKQKAIFEVGSCSPEGIKLLQLLVKNKPCSTVRELAPKNITEIIAEACLADDSSDKETEEYRHDDL